MNFFFPIIAATLEAAAMTLDKAALSIQKLNYKSYLGINFPLVTLVLLIAFIFVRPPVSAELFAGKFLLLIILCALISFASNLFYYRALSKDNLSELQIIDLLFGLSTALYASIFFADERKPIVLGLIVLVSIVIVWSHWEKHHFKIAKRTGYYLAWIVIFAPFSPLAVKELLAVWNPIALVTMHSIITTLLLAPIYFKYAPRASSKAFLTLYCHKRFQRSLHDLLLFQLSSVRRGADGALFLPAAAFGLHRFGVFPQRAPSLEKIRRFHHHSHLNRRHSDNDSSTNRGSAYAPTNKSHDIFLLNINKKTKCVILTDMKIGEIIISSPDYPECLRRIAQPPEKIFIRGEILPQDKNAVAIVGARRATAYGRQAAYDLAYALARRGVTVVSGMALGIDGEAHKGALDAGGRTIAVLGSGVDEKSIYPHTHLSLAREIAKHGAVISEFEPGAPSYPSNFPQRNRIISALSLGVVIAEAAEKSGSLITANFALEQGKDVFAIPGPIYSPASAGANTLIQQGAKLVRSADDIMEELRLEAKPAANGADETLTAEENMIMEIIKNEPCGADAVIKTAGLPPSVALAALTMLELKKKIKNLGNNTYAASI